MRPKSLGSGQRGRSWPPPKPVIDAGDERRNGGSVRFEGSGRVAALAPILSQPDEASIPPRRSGQLSDSAPHRGDCLSPRANVTRWRRNRTGATAAAVV